MNLDRFYCQKRRGRVRPSHITSTMMSDALFTGQLCRRGHLLSFHSCKSTIKNKSIMKTTRNSVATDSIESSNRTFRFSGRRGLDWAREVAVGYRITLFDILCALYEMVSTKCMIKVNAALLGYPTYQKIFIPAWPPGAVFSALRT